MTVTCYLVALRKDIIGARMFREVIKSKRGHYGGPSSSMKGEHKGEIWTWRHAHVGEQQVKTKVEIKVMLVQVKEQQTLPASHQKLEKGHGIDPLTALRRTQTCQQLDLGFCKLCETKHFYVLSLSVCSTC